MREYEGILESKLWKRERGREAEECGGQQTVPREHSRVCSLFLLYTILSTGCKRDHC